MTFHRKTKRKRKGRWIKDQSPTAFGNRGVAHGPRWEAENTRRWRPRLWNKFPTTECVQDISSLFRVAKRYLLPKTEVIFRWDNARINLAQDVVYSQGSVMLMMTWTVVNGRCLLFTVTYACSQQRSQRPKSGNSQHGPSTDKRISKLWWVWQRIIAVKGNEELTDVPYDVGPSQSVTWSEGIQTQKVTCCVIPLV